MKGTLALLQRRGIPHQLTHKGKLSYTFRDLKNSQLETPPHILLDVPLFAQPRDVRRACMEVKAIDSRVNIGHITAYPLGAPREASMTTQYHISLPNPQAAKHAHHTLLSYPPFAQPRTWDEEDTEPFVTFTPYSATEWAGLLLERAFKSAAARYAGSMQTAEEDRRSFDRITPRWAISSAGKRVLLRGLPAKVAPREIVAMFKDFDVQLPDVTKLPPNPWANESTWAVQLGTVEEAHRATRMFNAKYFLDSVFADRYPMRCQVAW